MDPTTFDRLTRIISASASRRGALAALLGSLGTPLVPGTDAARRRKTKGNTGRGKAKDKAKGRSKAKAKTKARAAKQRQSQAQAEAARCCAGGNCTPGKGKNLQKCCYQGQDLTGKNFSGANLGQANFSGATLTGANLTGANLGKACLVDADLRGVKPNSSTNWGGVIFCRTKTDSGENNTGCSKGTPCCPTCDDAHPCDDDEVCCNGRCVRGACCETADCPNEVCQRRDCQNNTCVYTPVRGEPGPGCDTLCCQDAAGAPRCCPPGTTTCDAQGLCCTAQSRNETCAVGTSAPKCGTVTNNCGQSVDCGPCAGRVCQSGSCAGPDNTCVYTPVFDQSGPGCPAPRRCCQDEQGAPVCCDPGVASCQISGVCGCGGHPDCGSGKVCCQEQCVNGDCCQAQECLPRFCQARACEDHSCVYTPIHGEPGPDCDTICCQDPAGAPTCCPPATTTCDAQGLCCRAEPFERTCGLDTPTPKCGEVVNNCGQTVFCGRCGDDLCQVGSCTGPDNTCVLTPVFAAPGPGCDTICCRDLHGAPDCCLGRQCAANGVCGPCPQCECIGTPNQLCSVFDGPPCCPGFVCTSIGLPLPFITECQFPCERIIQCVEVFGPRYDCKEGGGLGAEDCAFLDRCCQVDRSLGAAASKLGWPRNGEQFDALAKLIWTRTSRGATMGTIAGAALLAHPLAMAAGRKGGNGFAPGAATFRLPWRRRG